MERAISEPARAGYAEKTDLSATKQTIVTTSWDDGHPLDVRLAELLASYGVAGTFYVPLYYRRVPPVTRAQLQSVRNLGMEIGAHGINHTILTKTKDLVNEVVTSKTILENLIGEPISSLAYPNGAFNSAVCRVVADAGYRLARTTAAFRTSRRFDPYRMPVSVHFTRHTNRVLIQHALRGANFRGLSDWSRRWNHETDPFRLAELIFEDVLKTGGVLHIWGHSWELEALDLWESVECLLKLLAARSGVRYLTNRQTLDAVET